MGGVPNVRSGSAQLRYLGAASFTEAGSFTANPPVGTRAVRLEMRGGGGSSAGQSNNEGGVGGGQGALQRRLVLTGATPFPIVIGAGGPGGFNAQTADGGASEALGFIAAGGIQGTAGGGGGAGSDGAEPAAAGIHGNFTGSLYSSNGLYVNGIPKLGTGGRETFARPEATYPNAGAAGYCFLEFYG